MTASSATGFPDTIVLAESPVASRAAPAGSGNSAPAAGKPLPDRLPVSPAADPRHLAQALESANRTVGHRLRFEPDPDGGLAVIYVLDRATGELIRRIPSDEITHAVGPDGSLDLHLIEDRV